MQKILWYLNRLRSMDRAEVIWRLGGAFTSMLDLVRIPLKLYPSLDSHRDLHASTMTPGFSCSPVNGDLWKSLPAAVSALWTTRLIESADRILGNHLSYFDLVDVFHGEPVNWHRDFSASIDASRGLSILIDYRDFHSVGDCKLVWEPNRHQHLVVLGRAYVVTGDEKYAAKVVELLNSWIDANPFGYGMNWRSPLEIGIRLINWVWALDLIRASDALDDRTRSRLIECVYLSIWEIQRKYSRGSSANNHLIGEAAGVYIATGYFPSLPRAEALRLQSKEILEREILLQTYPDGCTREHAFGYQLFVLQFLSLCALTGTAIGDDFSENYLGRLHEMYRFVDDLSADSGSLPNAGDADDGYVLHLGELPDRPRQLATVGGQLFHDSSLMASEASETAFWLFGRTESEQGSASRARSSAAFRESGYYLMRCNDPAIPAEHRLSVFFDCAPLGFGSIAAHGHADCLSFTLAVGSTPVLVDPGTYDYFSYPEWRAYFRQTRAHNTLEVDGHSQSESLGPFMWGHRAEPRILRWHETDEESTVCGEHNGYTALEDPTIHERTLTLLKNHNEVRISDRLEASGYHKVGQYFHFHPACDVQRESDREVAVKVGPRHLILRFDTGDLEIHRGGADSKLGWVSSGYHRKEAATSMVIRNEIHGNTNLGIYISCR